MIRSLLSALPALIIALSAGVYIYALISTAAGLVAGVTIVTN